MEAETTTIKLILLVTIIVLIFIWFLLTPDSRTAEADKEIDDMLNAHQIKENEKELARQANKESFIEWLDQLIKDTKGVTELEREYRAFSSVKQKLQELTNQHTNHENN
jgi:hypothetical protein